MPTVATLSAAQLDQTNSILVNEAGRIGPDIYTKSLNTSAWINLAQRGTFPDEMGDIINVLTWERSLPGTGGGLTFTDVMTQQYFSNDGAPGGPDGGLVGGTTNVTTGTCLPTPATIGFGQTIRQYNLKQAAVQSPKICVHDLRYAAKRKDQLTAMFNILKDNTKWAWETYYRSAYTDLAEHKVVVTTSLTNVDGAETWTVPAGALLADKLNNMNHLSQGILDRIYLKLVREGAEPWGMENGRPVFAVVLSPEAQEFLFRGLGVLNLRDDFRYNNSRVNELLAPLGVERSYKGWYFLVDMFPRRFNFNAGLTGYDEVPPFVAAEATNGRKFILNVQYEVADIEEAYVYVREAVEFQVPKQLSSPGGGTSFTAQNYMGDFRWLNIPNETSNPDGTIGFFRGLLSVAAKPCAPDLATVIRFKRCAPNVTGLACNATADETPIFPLAAP